MSVTWRDVTLGDVFDISSAKRVLQRQWTTSGVPFYRAREIVKLAQNGAVQNELFISEELFQEYSEKYGVPKPGDLMVSAVGTLGACYAVQRKDRFYYKDASVLRFSAKEFVDPRFFVHAFRSNLILDQIHAGSGSTVGTFTIERAKKTRIALPPLAEQRRIAMILDAADVLRAKRREALAQLDTLLQSTFLDMFGDPVTNPMVWETETLINLCDDARGISYGVVQRGDHDPNGVPIVRIRDLLMGTIERDRLILCDRNITSKYKRTVLEGGELVISIRGTVGRTAVVPKILKGANITRELALIPLRAEVVRSFVLELIRTESVFLRLAEDVKGVAQRGINLRDLRELSVIQPPLHLQRRFATIVESVEQQKARMRAHLAELDALFASLQSRAFSGTL